MTNNIYKNFETYFPGFAKDVVEHYYKGGFELIVRLRDGDMYTYDNLEHTIRRLPRDYRNLSEDECRKEFAIRLCRRMFIAGVSQLELAEITGISRQSLSSYMCGKSIPSFHKVDAIAKALNCSVDEFRYLLK